jgi:hypothetical protein
MGGKKDYDELEHLKKLLGKAERGDPGPTVGQVCSWYFMERHHICQEIIKEFERGLEVQSVFDLTKLKHRELTMHHIEYVERHFIDKKR